MSIVSSTIWLSGAFSAVSVIRSLSSVPRTLPSRTTRSISRCEVMPTTLRNLRRAMLKRSSSIAILPKRVAGGPRTSGNQGVVLMLLSERRGAAEMSKPVVQQIEAAVTAMRDGGGARSAGFEKQLPKARALAKHSPSLLYRPVPRQPAPGQRGLSRSYHRPLPALRHAHRNALFRNESSLFFSCFGAKID